MAQGGKLGGILCESSGTQPESFIVIGLGINCVDAPVIADQQTRDLTSARGKVTHADELRLPLVSALLEEIQQLVRKGTSAVALPYSDWALFQPGTEVAWSTNFGKVQGLESVRGAQSFCRRRFCGEPLC